MQIIPTTSLMVGSNCKKSEQHHSSQLMAGEIAKRANSITQGNELTKTGGLSRQSELKLQKDRTVTQGRCYEVIIKCIHSTSECIEWHQNPEWMRKYKNKSHRSGMKIWWFGSFDMERRYEKLIILLNY